MTLSLHDVIDLSSALQPTALFQVYNNSIVCGVRTGSGRIQVTRSSGVTVGSLNINVTREDVQVLRLHVMVVGEVQVVATGPTSVSALGVQTTPVTVTSSSTFTERLQGGAVYAQALTTDGQLWPVMNIGGIVVASGGALAVTNGSVAVAETQGAGAIVDTTWYDNCTDLPIVNGFGTMNATFEVRFPIDDVHDKSLDRWL